MNGLFTCTRMGREVRISPQTCLSNHRQAEHRGKLGLMLFALETCRFCETGVELGKRYPEGKLPKPPTCEISPTDRPEQAVKHKAVATPTPTLPKRTEDGGRRTATKPSVCGLRSSVPPKKKAEVGRSLPDPPRVGAQNPDPGGTAALNKGKKRPKTEDRSLCSRPPSSVPGPSVCALCAAPAYGKSGLCFEHLRAETERKRLSGVRRQARYAAKKKTADRRPKTEDRRPLPFERQPGGAPGL
jgi:hypothetical protein